MCQRYNLKSNNRGATMVTVLIAVSFLTILGTIILFMSYTGFQIKASQAVGENRFYDAESGMDEVRAGVQGIVSEAIALSYDKLMKGFDDTGDIDDAFTRLFKYTFLDIEWDGEYLFELNLPGATIDSLFSPTTGAYAGTVRFNRDLLASFITNPQAVLVMLDSPDPGYVDIRGVWLDDAGNITTDVADYHDFRITEVTLRGLQVRHTSDDGYLSIVESDLTCVVPNIRGTNDLLSFRSIRDFAFIALEQMTAPGADVVIDGNAYVGNALLVGAVSAGGDPLERLTLKEGRLFISGGRGALTTPHVNGDITVIGKDFITEINTNVWANNIRVGRYERTTTGGTTSTLNDPGFVTLQGSTYTAGNLVLSGDRSRVTLGSIDLTAGAQGRFFGFGDGYIEIEDPLNPGTYISALSAANSSSIIVNSRNNRLDMYNLRQLYLAGHSFINATGAGVDGGEILTGQSMAVKSDQLAYLIPVTHLKGMNTNPLICTEDSLPSFVYPYNDLAPAPLTYSVDFDAPLWGTDDITLADYITAGVAGIQPVITQPFEGTDGQRMLYVFMRFSSIADANRYFMDYFSYNSDDITKYLSNYLTNYIDLQRIGSVTQSSGATYSVEKPATVVTGAYPAFPVGVPTNPNVVDPDKFADEYSNRRLTLTRDEITPNLTDNPFDFIVNSPPDGFYVDAAGVPQAYVSPNPGGPIYTSDPQYTDLKMIICYGDVYVDADFTGLILCTGNIIVSRNATAGGAALRDALLATNGTHILGNYLGITINTSDDDDDVDPWDFSLLVHYDNWRKN